MSLFGTIAKGVGGFLAGGPAGAVAAVSTSLLGGGGPRGPTGIMSKRPPIRIGSVGIDPKSAFPGGKPLFTSQPQGMNGKPPSGYHWNKSDYHLKDGTFVPAGTKLVKNRRKNPLNPTALRNAVSRVESGKTWQGKLREIETGKWTKAGKKKSCN